MQDFGAPVDFGLMMALSRKVDRPITQKWQRLFKGINTSKAIPCCILMSIRFTAAISPKPLFQIFRLLPHADVFNFEIYNTIALFAFRAVFF